MCHQKKSKPYWLLLREEYQVEGETHGKKLRWICAEGVTFGVRRFDTVFPPVSIKEVKTFDIIEPTFLGWAHT